MKYSQNFTIVCTLATLLLLSLSIPTTTLGQTTKKKDDDEPKIAAPESLTLETKDKVQLKATYFAPPTSEESKAGKATVPILLLHDWGEERSKVSEFGKFLQAQGFAVIAPDLRGHGESTKVTGFPRELDFKRFRRNELMSVQADIERCKKYLVQRHNEGKLNINLLTVVSVGKTCGLSAQWSIADWFAYPAINSEGIKQGEDVKALIFVAPRKKNSTMSLTEQIKHPLFTGEQGTDAIPLMIVWTTGDKEGAKDSEYIYEKLEKARPDVSDMSEAEKIEKQTLYQVELRNQKLTGSELLANQKVKGLWPYMVKFVKVKVSDKASNYPWKSREKKDSND